ncbi:hypothetical protein NXS19_012586 [Fusarium pseudograminearum]|uniref:Uncharacterized protein n=1 Tax=Fusarium pseudograminearum (strain CS3096) TaxID=1028729 RepID=K3VD80_FUSPC|nr:hypothetical protein FPSE_09387 [Fusarium pseudograminearum CS3096]EKJ70393.1 hypothetical protein FPSE_09387 [Fusarium pseudograminearum CS3096]KAF0639854.1 hypothetical protein FPSE5266_09387 [Fusarium pseudograminearum]UZP44774.1 hypothetical protein NXS19_012586 [Fusarium pseudograminearum]
MRLSLPFVALCAIPAAVGIAIPDSAREIGKSDYKHHGEHYHGVHKYHHGEHKHKHKHLHPHEHIHHVHHKHPIKPCHILTKERVCKDFHKLTDEVEKVIHVVQTKDCDNDESCWSGVVYHIYKLEHHLDTYDKEIDYTTLKKCFSCGQESYVVDCYLGYADALIRLLKVLKHKTKHLEGEVDRPVLTSINSLRSANYALTYEIGRRISCKKDLKIIMEKQGADDGSTKGSVQQAFSKFIYTPLITGDDFENKGSYGDPREKGYEGKSYNKEVKVFKHHHEHHHGHHHGHKHGHGHIHAHEHGHKHGHVYHKYHHDEYKHKNEEYKHDNKHKDEEYKHDDGYKHDNKHKDDEYKHDDGYKHDEYKHDKPHYHRLSVRNYRDPQFVDKDNYSLEPSNDQYIHNPYGAYRNMEREKVWRDREDEEEKRANDLEWFRRENMRAYAQAWPREPAPFPPKWHSPNRSPYNHYNGNRRWE